MNAVSAEMWLSKNRQRVYLFFLIDDGNSFHLRCSNLNEDRGRRTTSAGKGGTIMEVDVLVRGLP